MRGALATRAGVSWLRLIVPCTLRFVWSLILICIATIWPPQFLESFVRSTLLPSRCLCPGCSRAVCSGCCAQNTPLALLASTVTEAECGRTATYRLTELVWFDIFFLTLASQLLSKIQTFFFCGDVIFFVCGDIYSLFYCVISDFNHNSSLETLRLWSAYIHPRLVYAACVAVACGLPSAHMPGRYPCTSPSAHPQPQRLLRPRPLTAQGLVAARRI